MNEAAYDISHLLELEAIAPIMPELRSVASVPIKAGPSAVAMAQEALASELLQMEGHHEEMIRRYMSLKDDSVASTDW